MLILLNHTEQTAKCQFEKHFTNCFPTPLICCIPLIARANPNPLWIFSEMREIMRHLKSSRFCLCGHETLAADEVGVGIGANQVESLLEVRKFGLPVRV